MSTPAGRTTISARHVLLSEISAVTSTMRKNSRWATSNTAFSDRDSALAESFGLRVSGPASAMGLRRVSRERELMAGFNSLKRTVNDVSDIARVPLTTVLAPFFAIIRSPLSTGPITAAALSALHTFFQAGVISPESLSLELALAELSTIVSNCKFEASDSAGDQVVMLKILSVIEDALCGPASAHLGDVEVCEMLETVLTTCCQMRLSEVLRRSAERTMVAIVRAMASRLYEVDPSVEEDKLQKVRMNVAPEPAPVADTASEAHSDVVTETTEVASEAEKPIITAVSETHEFVPYGVPAMVELLRVLINILDPNDKLHTDSTRLVAMRVLVNFFEVGGARIAAFPSLASLISDHGCKYLFQLARSESPSVLQLALRTISTIFEVMREQLKLQQELFFTFTMDRLASQAPHGISTPRPGFASPRPQQGVSSAASIDRASGAESPAPSRPQVAPARGETKELMLDILSQLCNYPSFMVDLFTNYDCDINCENLFSRLIEFATTSIYSSPAGPGMEAPLQNEQYYCLEILLTSVDYMARRAQGEADTWPSNWASVEDLLHNKARKNLVTLGASLFNGKPKSGIAFLEENGVIYAEHGDEVSRPQSLARFLKSSTRLDKKLLGDYISKPENLELLKAFISLFDYKDKPVAEALRELLEAFRLPGESQQIARITETFAEVYFASKPAEIRSQDAVYVLTYSIIMLNTDQHNPQVRRRMLIDDYKKNLRGVNDGVDFSPEFLQNIYDSIRKKEIVMPQEQSGQLGFEYAWRELLARSRQTGPLLRRNTASFDYEMFKEVWQPLISAISYAFMSFDDDYVIERSITGFRQCATLAGHFHMADVFDYVVVTLSQTTSLLWESIPSTVPNYPVVEVNGQLITVSGLSVKFGTHVKGQLAAVVLFNIVNGNGNALREGWTQIFEMFENLFVHSLLPTRMLQMEDFLGGVSMIPLRGAAPPKPVVRNEGGLLSALSSYLMTPYSASAEAMIPQASESDVESTLSTIDCIAACRLDELYAQIIQLDVEALVAAIRALEALAHERTVARLKQESDDGPNGSAHTLSYDPASVFLLETMVSIACQTPQHIEEVWPVIMEHLSALLATPQQYSILLVERAVVGLLRLGRILATKPNLRDQLFISFDLLAGLHPAVRDSIAEQIVRGLLIIISQNRDIVRSQTEWNVVFSVLRGTLGHSEAAGMTFEYLNQLITSQSELVTADNYVGIIMLLDEVALVASVVAETHVQQRPREPPLSAAVSPVVERGVRSINLLYELKDTMARLLQQPDVPREQKWRQCCVPLLASLARHCSNAARELRQGAMAHLQRLILGPLVPVAAGGQRQVEELFSRVVFPMLDDLLKPAVHARDPGAMGATRLRAGALLCKAFMHFEVREGADADIRVLWIQVLDLLDRLMHADRRDQLDEAIPESLKNVVLVMHAAGVLVPPAAGDARTERQQALWAASQERIERFLPGFLDAVLAAPLPPSLGAPKDPQDV